MNHATDRQVAQQWARNMLATPRLRILDTETTGLDSSAEIVQIAVITVDGTPVMDTLVRPTKPIPVTASNIHGITDAHIELGCAPTWDQLLPELRTLLFNRELVIYNAEYDLRLMRQSAQYRQIPNADNHFTILDREKKFAGYHCAMMWYSQWVGDWNDYHGNYRWQRLPGGDHSALGDCLATLAVLKRMAGV